MNRPHPRILAALGGRPLVLASSSPRRKDLLSLLGVPFEIDPPDIPEYPREGETPFMLVARLSEDKAEHVSRRHPGAIVIGADTVVSVDHEILGKPRTDENARRMLRMLSGRSHEVRTGAAFALDGEIVGAVHAETTVTIVPLTDEVIDWYVATGEPHDKAGAYAIQGIGATLVADVDGSASSVAGLPIADIAGGLEILAAQGEL